VKWGVPAAAAAMMEMISGETPVRFKPGMKGEGMIDDESSDWRITSFSRSVSLSISLLIFKVTKAAKNYRSVH